MHPLLDIFQYIQEPYLANYLKWRLCGIVITLAKGRESNSGVCFFFFCPVELVSSQAWQIYLRAQGLLGATFLVSRHNVWQSVTSWMCLRFQSEPFLHVWFSSSLTINRHIASFHVATGKYGTQQNYPKCRVNLSERQLFNRQALGSRKIFGLADNRINSTSSVCNGQILVGGEERFLNLTLFETSTYWVGCFTILWN